MTVNNRQKHDNTCITRNNSNTCKIQVLVPGG